MTENDKAYIFISIEEMQMYIQVHGPLKDGKSIFINEEQIR